MSQGVCMWRFSPASSKSPQAWMHRRTCKQFLHFWPDTSVGCAGCHNIPTLINIGCSNGLSSLRFVCLFVFYVLMSFLKFCYSLPIVPWLHFKNTSCKAISLLADPNNPSKMSKTSLSKDIKYWHFNEQKAKGFQLIPQDSFSYCLVCCSCLLGDLWSLWQATTKSTLIQSVLFRQHPVWWPQLTPTSAIFISVEPICHSFWSWKT